MLQVTGKWFLIFTGKSAPKEITPLRIDKSVHSTERISSRLALSSIAHSIHIIKIHLQRCSRTKGIASVNYSSPIIASWDKSHLVKAFSLVLLAVHQALVTNSNCDERHYWRFT